MKLGLGIGWRPELAIPIDRRPDLGFVEIMYEDGISAHVEELRSRGLQVVVHGVSLSLGGAEGLDRRALKRMARVAKQIGAAYVSEHIAFVRAGGIESGHLLPVPRTREALEVLVENIRIARDALPVPLALENIAAIVDWPGAEMTEAEFLTEVLERTDTKMLLDVSNLYANARNHGWDPVAFLDRIPLRRIAYVHVAGGVTRGRFYHDTHAHAVPPGALDLLRRLRERINISGLMLERDDRFPSTKELYAELDAIAA